MQQHPGAAAPTRSSPHTSMWSTSHVPIMTVLVHCSCSAMPVCSVVAWRGQGRWDLLVRLVHRLGLIASRQPLAVRLRTLLHMPALLRLRIVRCRHLGLGHQANERLRARPWRLVRLLGWVGRWQPRAAAAAGGIGATRGCASCGLKRGGRGGARAGGGTHLGRAGALVIVEAQLGLRERCWILYRSESGVGRAGPHLRLIRQVGDRRRGLRLDCRIRRGKSSDERRHGVGSEHRALAGRIERRIEHRAQKVGLDAVREFVARPLRNTEVVCVERGDDGGEDAALEHGEARVGPKCRTVEERARRPRPQQSLVC
mmetsp:Transcript_19863/g.50518  ORF Transcript_19863/g.50518 Transcript_19863/m.50518 type:complete len:314 (+) Transcript_19863:331-1272(+)